MLQHPKGQILQRYCIASNDEASPIARSYRDDAFRILEANIPAGSRQTGRSGPSTGLVLLPWVGQTVRAVSACQQACVVPYRSPSVGQNSAPSLPFTNFFSPSQRLAQAMSQISPNASSSSSNFQSVFNAALDAYEKKTNTKLLTHPLAAQLQSCDSPTAILSVLQDLIQQFDRRRRSDERLTNWLNPTVNVLYAFSSTIGQGVGLVSLN